MARLKHPDLIGTQSVDAGGQQYIAVDGVVEVPASVANDLKRAGWIDAETSAAVPAPVKAAKK